MKIYMETTTKALNSTYQFPLDEGQSFEGEIWDGTSVLSPTIRFFNTNRSMLEYKLAHIPQFSNRYYFISDWVWQDGYWNAEMTVDVLATYKTQIGNFPYYITRCAAIDNEVIVDSKYPTVGGRYTKATRVSTGWSDLEANSSYVLGVYGSEQGDPSPISYYVLSYNQMTAFKNALFASTDWLNPDLMGISADLAKGLVNPIQYIASCNWFPFIPVSDPQPDDPEMPLVGIKLGWWTVPGGEGYVLKQGIKSFGYTLSIPKSNGKGNYMNLSPYAEYWLYCPPFGHIPVDSSILFDATELYVRVDVDCCTGLGALSYSDPNNNRAIMTRELTQFGVSIPVASKTYDLLGAATQAVGDAANTVSSLMGGVGGAIAYGRAGMTGKAIGKLASGLIGGGLNAVTGVSNAVAGTQPSVNARNSLGSMMNFENSTPMILYGVFRNQSYHAQDTFGNPVMRSIKPSEIPGYIEIAKPYFRPGYTDEEKSAIVQHLETGFYYE